jgi:hypothetical protein
LASETDILPVQRVTVAQCCFQQEKESVFIKRHDIPEQIFCRSNSKMSPGSGAGNVTEPRLIWLGRYRESFCALIGVYVQSDSRKCQFQSAYVVGTFVRHVGVL